MPRFILSALVYLMLLFTVQNSWAASGGDYGLGVSAGPLITSGVRDWNQVVTIYNLHFAFKAWEAPLELTLMGSQPALGTLLGARLTLTGEHVIENDLSIHYWLGPSYISLKPEGSDEEVSSLGGALGGGLLIRALKDLHIRIDMAVISSPGSNAYSGFGLIYLF